MGRKENLQLWNIRNQHKFLLLTVFFVFLISSHVYAANVALVVKDANALSTEHEKEIKNALLELGHTLTYVDKNSVVDYNNFDLIVIAGRPKDSTESLDSFVASIPVNTKPTVAVDGKFVTSFGWASSVSSIHSTNAQTVYIYNPSHPITSGLSGTVTVHSATGKSLSAIQSGDPLSFAATASSQGSKGAVAYANSKTQLLNGQKTKNRVVFFGITSPLYWTANAEKLFKQSVNWALGDTDGDGVDNSADLCPNTPPEYVPDSNGCVNTPPSLTITSPAEGANINEGTIMTINVNASDAENNSLTFTVKVDGNVVANEIPAEYTWSFNSAGAHVVIVIASDSVNSVEKQVNINVVDASYEQGLKAFTPESATIEEGSSLLITVEAYDDNLLDIKLYKDGNLVKSFNGYVLKYNWIPNFDEAGSHTFSFNATGDDISLAGERTYAVTDVASIQKDVDADGIEESAVNKDGNSDNGYEFFFDPNGNSAAVAVNGNDDDKADFVINNNKYWSPSSNVFTSAGSENLDNAGDNETVFDTSGDGVPDRIFVNNALVKYPDLTADISFSNSAPNSGEVVQINAVVKNVGGFGASDFVAEIYVDNVLKDNKTISVGASESKTLTISYTATKTHEVKVKVDTTNKIKESNENNEFTKPLSLYSPPSTPPSSGGGGGSSIVRSVLCTLVDSEVTVDEGSAYALNFNVKNTGNVFLSNVRLNVNGFPATWLSISPQSDTILVGRTSTFSMVFDARSDGVYDVSIEVLSDSFSLCKRSFRLKVNNVEQPQQPLVEETYPEFEITDFQISQQDISLLLTVKVKNSGSDGSAVVGIDVPEDWPALEEQTTDANSGEEKIITFTIAVPENAQGSATITAHVSYDSATGLKTKSMEQVLAIEQSSPLTGLFASSGSTLLFVAIASATFVLLALHRYTSARRPPWYSSIARYSFHNGSRFSPLLLLLLAIPAYFVHPAAGVTVAGTVLAMYIALKIRTSKNLKAKLKRQIYDFQKSRR